VTRLGILEICYFFGVKKEEVIIIIYNIKKNYPNPQHRRRNYPVHTIRKFITIKSTTFTYQTVVSANCFVGLEVKQHNIPHHFKNELACT
jgi:hypothetical protein